MVQKDNRSVVTTKYKEYTTETLPISAGGITRLQLARDNIASIRNIAELYRISVEEVMAILEFADTHETELDALYDQQLEKLTQKKLEALRGIHTAKWRDYAFYLIAVIPGTWLILQSLLTNPQNSFALTDIILLLFIGLISIFPWFQIVTRLQTAYVFNENNVLIKGRWFSDDEYISNAEIRSVDIHNSPHRQEVTIILLNENFRSLTLLSSMKTILDQFEESD